MNGAICWAYNEDGTICRRPATAIDTERGYAVCELHDRRRRPKEGEMKDEAENTRIRS